MEQQTTPGNRAGTPLPPTSDADLHFIGKVHTPWHTREDAPPRGDTNGPLCVIEVFEPWMLALKGVERYPVLEVLYWLHESRRDLLLQNPARTGELHGAFSIRSAIRPNPIGTSIVKVVNVTGSRISVRGLDCVDGTPLLDIKPERSLLTPMAAPKGVHPMDTE